MPKPSFIESTLLTIKGISKIIIASRISSVKKEARHKPLIVMGNGPSLSDVIHGNLTLLQEADTLAVNFAANAPEFSILRPDYYILADPHFFVNPDDPNVSRLYDNISQVDWPMTLLIPRTMRSKCAIKPTEYLDIQYYNSIGAEGFRWFTNFFYRHGLAMPRPRNVLIPAIMTGIQLGYKEIYLAGADHSWTRTLSVDDDNHVISVQPHFYRESESEQQRIRKDYLNVTIDEIMYSFHVAFKAYRGIRTFADSQGVAIYNSTPGSFIDAFPRRPLPNHGEG